MKKKTKVIKNNRDRAASILCNLHIQTLKQGLRLLKTKLSLSEPGLKEQISHKISYLCKHGK